MSRPKSPFLIAAAIGAVVMALAFVAAPRSCEGGLTFYFVSGVAAVMALFALPFLSFREKALGARFAWSFAFSAFGIAVWIAGLFLANVRIMCRLF